MRKQNGFSMAVIVVLIVSVLIAGLIIWRIWDAGQTQQNNTNNQQGNSQEPGTASQNNNQPTTDPNEGYVVIKEWGVRFKPVDGLGGVEYFRSVDTPTSYDRFELSTEALVAREPNCQKHGFSSITRTTEPQTIYENQLVKVGNYFYYYRGSDAACSENSGSAAFEIEQRNAVKQSVLSLEAAK